MRILFVAMPDSLHTARWINQISEQDWDIHLYPSLGATDVHPALKRTNVHIPIYGEQKGIDSSITLNGFRLPLPVFSREMAWHICQLLVKHRSAYYTQCLVRLIRRLKPDIVHSLEIQHAGYLAWSAKKVMGAAFPVWIVTNWGSDIYLFGRLSKHRQRIKEVLAFCDYYSCECERDVQLAKDLGFQGRVLPVIPNTGGFDLKRLRQWSHIPPSSRRVILVKGYQHFAGRALFALRAIALCSDLLKSYRILIYNSSPDVEIAAEILSLDTGIAVEIVPPCSHDEMLQLYGRSRIYVGLSISDAISTSLLEAMVMGAFPIQSGTSCANEWIEDGVSGLIVPPEDPHLVAQALRRALVDNELVDRAAECNAQVCTEHLAYEKIQAQATDFYRQAANNGECDV
jgi:glycosyltransferase involved in cell wall biosynthesis